MAWNLRAMMTETCSCNMFCPCWYFNQEYMVMDRGWCASAILFQIEDGASDGVDLSGRTVAWAVHFPGPTLFEGGGTARLYVDDGASSEQRAELETIFQGKNGGPMEAVGGLVASWLPTETTSIDITKEGDTISASVGEYGQLKSEPLRDVEGNGFTLRGGGFVGGLGLEEAELAPGKGTSWADPDLPRSFESISGGRGQVTWSG